jgi:hypothetical protein
MSAPAPPPPEAEACAPLDVVCQAKEGAADAVASGATDAIANMADAVAEALGKALTSLGTVWVSVETPNLTGGSGGASTTVAFLQDSLWFYMAGFAVLAVIIGGARMAWEQRAEPGRELLRSLLVLTVVSGAGLTGIALAVTAADGFAQWVLERSTTGTDFGANMANLLALDATVGTGLGPLLVIILGLCAIFASFVQIMLMIARAAMLVILAGILPLTASFTSTETGRAWLRRALGWTAAFVLYKPAAAVVYATAFRLTGSNMFGDDGSGLTNVLVGLVLMVLALFALPALMRFVTPLVASTASGSGGGGLGAAAAAAVPTGAVTLATRPTRAGSTSGTGSIPAQPPGPGGSGSGGSGSGGAGPTGRPGPGGGAGPSGPGGPVGTAAAAPAAAGTTSAASTAGSGAATAGAGAAGTGAAAAGGPATAAGGAALDGAVRTGKAGTAAARGAAEQTTTTEEGPRGSR